MFFPQALETLVCWGWLTPVHTHSQLFTPTCNCSHPVTLAHTCTHRSHLFTL